MKSFIKSNLKVFASIFITTIIVGSVSVYAASQYFAKDISFTPTNENFKKENGEPIVNVEDALNELYNLRNVNNFEMHFGSFEMGSRSGITNNDLVKLNNINGFKKMTLTFGGNIMGKYISARIYVDNELIITVSDFDEHEIQLNNNSELKINFYSYNGLDNGRVSVNIKAE